MLLSWAIAIGLGATLAIVARTGSVSNAIRGAGVGIIVSACGLVASLVQGHGWQDVLFLKEVSFLGRSIVIGYGLIIGFAARAVYEAARPGSSSR